nr:hypothetical protein SHINE37_44111 [Rhizobiaceae bacterium]
MIDPDPNARFDGGHRYAGKLRLVGIEEDKPLVGRVEKPVECRGRRHGYFRSFSNGKTGVAIMMQSGVDGMNFFPEIVRNVAYIPVCQINSAVLRQ